MSDYKPTIGLEIHAELKTKTKMFCDSPNDPDASEPNVNVCPVCMGHPGTLPTINKEAIEKLIKVGLALNCDIAEVSKFDRKNYFYPDLPKGYQISQYDMPVCAGGHLELADGTKIHLERIHMEEDAGTLKHSDDKSQSYVDYNRASVPLMELVTKPDIHSAEDVERFARELQLILRYLEASDANIEKGQMRVEVNLSLNKQGDSELGTKVEVKNIGSINAAMRAAKYEVKRQTQVLESGAVVVQETRGWDDGKDASFSQRSKEEAHDYRYFPEPDLPPMRFMPEYIETLRAQLPELPAGRRKRFKTQYGLKDDQIEIMTVNKLLGDFYEDVISEAHAWANVQKDKQIDEDELKAIETTAAKYLITNYAALDDTSKITAENMAELILKVHKNELSSTASKTVLEEMAKTGADPDDIIKDKDLAQVSDTGALEGAIDTVIAAHHEVVQQYKDGKEQALGFLIGKVMAETQGKANPQMVRELLIKNLK